MSGSFKVNAEKAGYALTFSYLGAAALCDKKLSPVAKSNWMGLAVMNVLAYIPGISLIVGIARIIFSQLGTIFTEKNGSLFNRSIMKEVQQDQVLRGILECCTIFSPGLLITDVAMTIKLLN